MLLTSVALPALALDPKGDDLSGMSLEELGNIQITSVSKAPELLREAAAAIYVITQDEIQRSGATTLAEALRLAPNLDITQLGANNYVAAARGFGGNPSTQSFSNKLLLLIDGRSTYSPLFSGIYLDTQDVVLSDISRIEVISGPGSTLWGANAMNGVINVITRPAYLTAGSSLVATAGNDEQDFSFRYGARVGESSAFRVYGKAFQHDSLDDADGTGAHDGWHRAQAGFRLDMTPGQGTATLQGDVYGGANDREGPGSQGVSGANILGRWQQHTARSDFHIQTYFDHVQRGQPGDGVPYTVDTADIEAQQSLILGTRNNLVWGAGARINHYSITNSASLLFLPPARKLHIWNLFGQDTITLNPALKLTLGLKLEHNSYTGLEPQPDLRLAWQATTSTLIWAAASRAIRAPTPLDVVVLERIAGTDFLAGNPDFKSEDVVTYETGIRTSVTTKLSLSMSAFYNQYDDLRSVEFSSTPTFLPLRWDNLMEGHTYGLTSWATWQVTDWWRLAPGFTLLRKRLHFKPGASGLIPQQSGDDPRSHALLNSSMDLGHSQSLDVYLRHVAPLPNPALRAYTELSARYAWRVSASWELSVRGINLLHDQHLEFPAPAGVPIDRSVMAEVRWSH